MTETRDNTLPLIIFVDDEPRNLTLVEAIIDEDVWRLETFDNATEGFKAVKEMHPAVIISDQRMPNMTGLEFLEQCAEHAPDAVRMVVTGQTDERTIVELIQRAKLFDYVVKPWHTNDFLSRVEKAINYYQAIEDKKKAFVELEKKNQELEKSKAYIADQKLQMEGWIPWPLVEEINAGRLSFPFHSDMVCMAFDIIDSSQVANVMIEGRSVRTLVMKIFREMVLHHGGMTESQSGDSCYAHFGAVHSIDKAEQHALNAACEFRVRLEEFSKEHGITIECGIAVHLAHEVLVDQDTIRATTPDNTPRTERTLVTQHSGVDLTHRMEKLAHQLTGSNIIVSAELLKSIDQNGLRIKNIGKHCLKGQRDAIELFLIPCSGLSDEECERFAQNLASLGAESGTEKDDRQAA